MAIKPNPRAEAEMRLCQSKDTEKLYYGLFVNDIPKKYWALNDLSPAAKDLLEELITAFDLGYDIRFQFPVHEKDGDKVYPKKMKMYNEPGAEKSGKTEEVFFCSERND